MGTRIAYVTLAFGLALGGCGAKSGLMIEDVERDGSSPAPLERSDAKIEDAVRDVHDAPDVFDARPDVFDARADVVAVDCQEAGITYIYLISAETNLLRFDPPSKSFTTIGSINCPASLAQPFSMAVDRAGIAYVVYDDGALYRVSTLTASCQPTSFVSGGFSPQFGMGFSANGFDAGETLFIVSSSALTSNGPAELATIDTLTFAVSPIGSISPQIGDAELTGTGDARLFAFAPGPFNAHVAELSKSDARVLSDVMLNLNEAQPQAWAFAFWGGDFYIFTSPTRGSSVVHRYTPGGSTTPEVFANVDVTIVGAGVSTCAPSK